MDEFVSAVNRNTWFNNKITNAVSVVIPVFNNWDLTRQCLSSLAENSPADLEVIVVDNGSTDETATGLEPFGQTLFAKRFRRVRFEENRNFAPACNAGAQTAHSEFLFFLNNDTIIQPGWLPPLLAEFSSSSSTLGAVGPLLTYQDDTVQHLGVAIWPGGTVGHLYQNLPASHSLATRKRFFKVLTGAALLMPRALFLREGGFDEGYVNGFEDVDLGLRLTRNGYKQCCIPGSQIIHLESKTPHRHDHYPANSRRLLEKWNMSAYADLPDLVADDGYVLHVMPELELKIALSSERSAAYIHRLRPFNAVDCFSFLKEEPLWVEGYTLLGKYCERAGEWETALQLYYDAAKYSLCCSFEDYKRLIRVMKVLKWDTSSLEEGIELLYCRIDNRDNYESTLQSIMRQMAEGSPAQRALVPLYEQAGEQARLLRRRNDRVTGM